MKMFIATLILVGMVLFVLYQLYRQGVLSYLLFTCLLAFFLTMSKNCYDAGVYADMHQLEGSTVGWFGTWNVPIAGLALVLVLADGVYLVFASRKRAAAMRKSDNSH